MMKALRVALKRLPLVGSYFWDKSWREVELKGFKFKVNGVSTREWCNIDGTWGSETIDGAGDVVRREGSPFTR